MINHRFITRKMIDVTEKDIIAINQMLDAGKVVNKSSLDFALTYSRRTRNWLKSLALLTRAILIDHVFEEGNKRTAAAVIITYMDINHISYNKDKIGDILIRIIKKNITNVNTIARLIEDVI